MSFYTCLQEIENILVHAAGLWTSEFSGVARRCSLVVDTYGKVAPTTILSVLFNDAISC